MTRLQANSVTLSYGGPIAVIQDLSLRIPDGAITSIIGPNGCGKSTLLRSLARMLTPRKGVVLLDGEAIYRQPTKEVAKRLSLLSQQPSAPEAITVKDLARRGRYPHQGFLQPPSRSDQAAVEYALELANMTELGHRPVDELSGGQRQRAWIAMALAQETPLLLLDEPTTYLDIAHQQEILSLVEHLNREEGRTVVMVQHNVNNAAQVSDHLIAMKDGLILTEGSPDEVLTPSLLKRVFGISCDVVTHPGTKLPVSMPRSSASFVQNPCPEREASHLRAEELSTGYERRRVVEEVTISPPPGQITAIVGPNACGKSTLLKAFGRLLRPMAGTALLDGRPVTEGSHRHLARRLALLGQGAITPDGVLVEDLVAVGRYPHQCWYRQWSPADQKAIDKALEATDVADLRWRPVETLSGGQRQRVWLAMALAQRTPVLLLDEPTTFLDIAHQVEVLDLVWEMNRAEGQTVVLVLHDLSQACRYADYLMAMKDGRIAAAGTPNEVVTAALVRAIFNVEGYIVSDPLTGKPLVLPPGEARSKRNTSSAGILPPVPAQESRNPGFNPMEPP